MVLRQIIAGVGMFIGLAMLALLITPNGRALVSTSFTGVGGLFRAAEGR
jgi:hypothetical protein